MATSTTSPNTASPTTANAEALNLTSAQSGQADSALSLGFDDSKPTVTPEGGTRFPERGRSLRIPVFRLEASGATLLNPLPASGLSRADSPHGGITLEGTPGSPDAIFAVTDAPSQAVATLYDVLAHKYPNLESNLLWRLAKVATYVAIDVPLMVAAHEMGHGGAALGACPSCSPNVVMTGWMSGYTQYNLPPDQALSAREELFISVAGMNQATYNGEEIHRRMHTEGGDLKDAIGYLANITNSVNYQIKDWATQASPGYNDAATYHSMLAARDKGWTQENLSMLALGVNLLNVDFWASLIGSINYIATGREVKMPELRLGQTSVSMPHLSLMHTYEGPQLNVSVFGHRQGPETLELKYSQILTPDNGPALGFETRLHNLAIPGTADQLSISPRVGVSVHDGQFGFKTGVELEYRPAANRHVSLTVGGDYRHNYLVDAPLPQAAGFQATAGVKLSFW
ncbi:MAG: hypothetical protein CVV27_11970 [Candidatus Melainabacteria bacterium HGW-Melainabacteria-1]|nr:MAG: hypothetical protein CVV27_11970 [Candidatus Melainabacteria bacterium HGW-Melainabacteria-1]